MLYKLLGTFSVMYKYNSCVILNMKYTKHLTVKEWKKFDNIMDQENGEPITGQEILLRKYKIILTDHRTRKDKFNDAFDKIFKADINKTLNKVTKHLDEFSKMTDSLHGIGGEKKDLTSLLGTQKNMGTSIRGKDSSVSYWGTAPVKAKKKRKAKKKIDTTIGYWGKSGLKLR